MLRMGMTQRSVILLGLLAAVWVLPITALRAQTDSELQQQFDQALAHWATRISVTRHAGTHETVYTATGPVTLQRGKDLGDVATIIGTGGLRRRLVPSSSGSTWKLIGCQWRTKDKTLF